MLKKLFLKLASASVVIVILSIFSFALLNLMPGDPIDLLVTSNHQIDSKEVARLKEAYGLNRSFTQKYITWAASLFSGDLGYSRNYSKPVKEIISPRVSNSIKLVGFSILVSIILSLIVVFVSSHLQNNILKRAINIFTLAGISSPTFWIGLILIYIFSVKLKILPAGGAGEKENFSFLNDFKFVVLPGMTLIIALTSFWSRYLKGAYDEILREDFIKVARGKGLSDERIFLTHGLKNLAVPLITVVAIYIPAIFGGAFVTETVFSWPGAGRLLYDSIVGNDYNVAMILLLIFSSATVFTSFCADLFFKIFDPRITN